MLCIPIDVDECNTANGGCDHNCTNTVGSFICSCDTGYQLDESGLNCIGKSLWIVYKYILHDDIVAGVRNEYHFHCNSDINECEGDDLNNCHENAQCTNTEGSFNCSCNPGYTGDGVTCTSKLIMRDYII